MQKTVNILGNIYPSKGQNGNIYAICGVSPCILSGGDPPTGGGRGSCNAPKVLTESVIY